MVVENRTGAGGTVGMDTAMKSPPDGYTVLITNDNAASAPHIMSMPYDYTKELTPVIYLTRQQQVLGAHPSINVNSVAELIEVREGRPADSAMPRRASARTSTSSASGSRRKPGSSSTTSRTRAPDRRSTIWSPVT